MDNQETDDLLKKTIADFEKHIISSALRQTGGNQSEAARRLGTTKRILMYRVQKYGIDLNQFGLHEYDDDGRTP